MGMPQDPPYPFPPPPVPAPGEPEPEHDDDPPAGPLPSIKSALTSAGWICGAGAEPGECQLRAAIWNSPGCINEVVHNC